MKHEDFVQTSTKIVSKKSNFPAELHDSTSNNHQVKHQKNGRPGLSRQKILDYLSALFAETRGRSDGTTCGMQNTLCSDQCGKDS